MCTTYYSGITGHSIDNYANFKAWVHYLIKHGILQFKKLELLLNMEINSMFDHKNGEDKGVNIPDR